VKGQEYISKLSKHVVEIEPSSVSAWIQLAVRGADKLKNMGVHNQRKLSQCRGLRYHHSYIGAWFFALVFLINQVMYCLYGVWIQFPYNAPFYLIRWWIRPSLHLRKYMLVHEACVWAEIHTRVTAAVHHVVKCSRNSRERHNKLGISVSECHTRKMAAYYNLLGVHIFVDVKEKRHLVTKHMPSVRHNAWRT
jgi:hypothetical protein